MRNKQVEFNPYIYTLSKLSRFGYEISICYDNEELVTFTVTLIIKKSLNFVLLENRVLPSKKYFTVIYNNAN